MMYLRYYGGNIRRRRLRGLVSWTPNAVRVAAIARANVCRNALSVASGRRLHDERMKRLIVLLALPGWDAIC